MDWFKIGKRVHQGCILSPCLFNLFAGYIMQNPELDEALAGIKIAWRNINNLRYINDTILVAESKEELKSLLMKVKEENGKTWLNIQHSKNKDQSNQSHHFRIEYNIEGAKVETVTDFLFLGSKFTVAGNSSHKIKRHLLLGRKVMTNLDSLLKSRDITFPTKVHIVKTMDFPVVIYRCESWTIKG